MRMSSHRLPRLGEDTLAVTQDEQGHHRAALPPLHGQLGRQRQQPWLAAQVEHQQQVEDAGQADDAVALAEDAPGQANQDGLLDLAGPRHGHVGHADPGL